MAYVTTKLRPLSCNWLEKSRLFRQKKAKLFECFFLTQDILKLYLHFCVKHYFTINDLKKTSGQSRIRRNTN